MEKHLHIVSFDVPYPADYGGVIPVFNTITALHRAGIQVHLHCFEYGRGQQPELNKYCSDVQYYERQKGHKGFSHRLPYIVTSRINPQLFDNLLRDRHPVLLEGIHCSYLLHDRRFLNRKIFLRLHNVECEYYRQLFYNCRNIFKKMYYYHESKLLKKYEQCTADKATILAMSQHDAQTYCHDFGARKVVYLPSFVPFTHVSGNEGIGCFCLYHGNLSVVENERAASWLLKDVFNGLNIPFIIAGKNPSRKLKQLASDQKNICLVADPSEEEMQDMISKAQINILPSFNKTGIKLKLLNALFNGRHCVVNEATVEGTCLESACHIGNNADAFKSIIIQLFRQPFYEEEIRLRRAMLEKEYNNEKNAERLIQSIW